MRLLILHYNNKKFEDNKSLNKDGYRRMKSNKEDVLAVYIYKLTIVHK